MYQEYLFKILVLSHFPIDKLVQNINNTKYFYFHGNVSYLDHIVDHL